MNSARVVDCIKLKQSLPGLVKPPFPNDLGNLIYERVSQEAWDQWKIDSVKYINTYSVDLSTKEGTEFMIKQLRVYFGFEDGELAKTAWTPPKD